MGLGVCLTEHRLAVGKLSVTGLVCLCVRRAREQGS